MIDDLPSTPVAELAEGIRDGTYAPTDVVGTCLDRIDALDDELNAFVTVTDDLARETAREREAELAAGDVRGPLHGVPVAIKDSRAVAGVRHTWGTKLLADNVAETDDDLVRRLREAGAVVVGKTNIPEFALLGGTDNRLIGPTANPFDHEKMVGGSSGGSAAAVAAGLVPLAQGEDGGGSLRNPASTCGIYTLKPTFGRIGEFSPGRADAFTHTPMQCAGPLARRVDDAALMLDVLAEPHDADPFSLPAPEGSYRDAVGRSVESLEIAYSPALDLFPIEDRVRRTIEDAVGAFEEAGASVERVHVDFGHDREAIGDAFMLGSNVATTLFGERLAEAYGIDVTGADRDAVLPAPVEQFEAGREYSALAYKRADEVRTDVYDAIRELLGEYDLLAAATMTVLPFDKDLLRTRAGPAEVGGTRIDDSRWGRVVDWRTTQITNMTGHPAASIPAGFADGLPVGMELVGPRFDEETVLAASGTFERVNPWADAYERVA